MTDIRHIGRTDVGRQREENQDTFLAEKITFMGSDAVLLAAVDGVGGFAGGDMAARTAAESLRAYLDVCPLPDPEAALEQAMVIANNEVFNARRPGYDNMGCVASACVLDGSHAMYYAHVGDTRIYVYKDGLLQKVSHDHSPVGAMEEEGGLTEQEAMEHPDRNIIFRMLGEEPHHRGDGFVEHGTVHISGPSQVLLCSDGLTDQLCAREIKAILDEDISLDEKVVRMIREANIKGGKDNITVVLAEVNAPDDESAPADRTEQTKETNIINMNETMNYNNKKNGIIAMIVVTLCFILGCFSLYWNQRPMLETVEKAYGEKRAACMNGDLPARTLETVLVKNGYYQDEDDARCISRHWTSTFANDGQPVETLWELRRWTYQLPALKARSEGGKVLRALADSSFAKIGVTPEVKALYVNGSIPTAAMGGDAVIEARVVDSGTHEAVPGTIVRLKEHYYETVLQDTLDRSHVEVAKDSVVAYAMTDASGIARFDAIPGRSYSVLPIKEGYEYGQEKGTVRGVLKAGRTTYTFNEREHRIGVFHGSTYSDIKSSMAITVRTPEEYTGKYLLGILIFLLSWWFAFIAVRLRDRKLGQPSETALIPVLMLITGVGLLAQFGMLNPLTDKLLGFKTALTIGLATVIFVVLQRLDIVRWYASDYRLGGRRIPFDLLMRSSYRPLGLAYAIAAIALLVLLCFFGTSPENSDAKISLFGAFQPADLVKFLVVFFLAAFFSAREDEIRAFSKTTDKVSLRLQLRTIALVCTCILAICAIYLIVLSSMGEGLILVLVFICCYSVARGDLWQMTLGVVSYVAIVVVAEIVSPSVWAVVIASILWLALWLGISLLRKKVIYESAVFFNLLLFIIAAGGGILKMIPLTSHQGEKLLNRKEMTFSGVWENKVPGAGDQVFLSIQGIATGGVTGLGLGKGHPNLTPAFTNDMIISGISEQMGFVSIVCLMLAYMFLAYFGMKTALKSGHPFVYYLVFGITLATVIQWLYIFGATLGLFCLSGVPAPMLAYGKSSLLCHIVAYSLVIAASRYPVGKFDRPDAEALGRSPLVLPVIFMVAILLLGYNMRYAVFEQNRTIARHGVFLTSDGDVSVEYNPRIAKVLDRLDAGDVYDRNGHLLATSSREKVLDNIEDYADCGIPASFVKEEAGRDRRRYYPYGIHLSYVLGTHDDKVLWSNSLTNPYGPGIEHRYFSFLRGFDNTRKDIYGNATRETVTFARRHPDRFLPERSVEVSKTVNIYNYTPIVPLVKRGGSTRSIKNWNEKREGRDITLTLDAKLQTVLQRRMAEKIAEDPVLSRKPRLIVDVFVQEVKTGDMLASANYPLPDLEAIRDLNSKGRFSYDESDPNARAKTMRDAGFTQTPCGSAIKPAIALAGQMSHGEGVFNQTFYVDEKEIIERGRVKEPYGYRIGFDEAMRESSNCFFVFFGLHNDVFRRLGELFKIIGIRLDGHDGRGTLVPYVFNPDEITPKTDGSYDAEVDYMRSRAIPLYQAYEKLRDEEGKRYRLNAFRGSGEWWGWFYGQSTMHASPSNMARLVSIIAGDGIFVPTRYVLKLGDKVVSVKDSVEVVPGGTGRLQEAMCSEAQKHRERGYALPGAVDGVGSFFSKTGTPERGLYVKDGRGGLVYTVQNDGWYIFALPCSSTQSYLAVAIRMERLGSGGSSLAVKFASEVVIPAFRECGYEVN